ncbi:DUF676-domain-containing protein [Mytilinidion resinicola]|uniref:DUF676-domain-containing protein n=1 Tax=Mytilinidion resinicola TaxID=574789 RepID=A0A6A6YZE7_9PEZI|nr:DUF676-domain-containing protein [Mytilinidion resinicola]KAF2814292.1 DUF676-domain-containing protein [Mytilinidion resinicola]
MLLTARSYGLAQLPDKGCENSPPSFFLLNSSKREQLAAEEQARRMLLVHQIGSVKVGEVIRYSLTYTPSEDRILPSPTHLHVKIKNSSAIPLRAAYLHGPYTIHVATYPSTFNPNRKVESPKKEGIPEFEPNLKAGGSWSATLTLPEDIREVSGKTNLKRTADGEPKSATWIIEIASQILFSTSASVNYELLVARDERSLDLGFSAVTGNNHGAPGHVKDHQQAAKRKHNKHHSAQPKGVYSKAVKLVVEDTEALWNKPQLPVWADDDDDDNQQSGSSREHSGYPGGPERRSNTQKRKKIHLVIITHGLHSNTGADMLYLKESIDASAKEAREGKIKRRKSSASRAKRSSTNSESPDADKSDSNQGNAEASTAPLSGGQEDMEEEEDSDDEEVVVRGFHGNAIRTERGIQYLGKRLAKYVLELTYPDQPFLPVKTSTGKKLSNTFSTTKADPDEGVPAHAGSSILRVESPVEDRAYRYTSISFVGHSLGGLVQTYAIAYIHKHSPTFFEVIEPVNFISLASPYLGLSNENPMYIKFALDFGLVGRTGQDLGLTWRAPTIARSGWTAMISGLGSSAQKEQRQPDPGSKPLLRILPTGPAHHVLRMFRNRTLYSNVVNDGIVPLRTSCLLFLDWRGLGKVDKARRDNGLIGTVAGWGWGQLTGQNTSSPNPSRVGFSDDDDDGLESPSGRDDVVPQPGVDVTNEDNASQNTMAEPEAHQFLDGKKHAPTELATSSKDVPQSTNTLSTFLNFLRPSAAHTSKDRKMFRRSQTVAIGEGEGFSSGPSSETVSEPANNTTSQQQSKRPGATRGDSILNNPMDLRAPPKTTIFESAGDLLSPPVPPTSWIIDPASRSRTIFHDRVYHPEDIPPPPVKRPSRLTRSFSSEQGSFASGSSEQSQDDSGGMRVEEKIARAYHKDLSWRKVLVRLEPDAHNNIIVRRMFANAYGWPVVKHLCDTHFADTYAATTRDENEPAVDRANGVDKPVKEDGEEVKGQSDLYPPAKRTVSEMREVADELAPLKGSMDGAGGYAHSASNRSLKSRDSTVWDDSYFDGTSDEDDDDEGDDRNAIQKFLQRQPPKSHRRTSSQASDEESDAASTSGTSQAEIADFLTRSPPPMEGHRGLGVSPRKVSASPREPDSLESMHTPRLPKSPDSSQSLGNTAGLGLRRSLELASPTSPSEGRKRSGSGRVEQVARLSFS